MFGFRTEIRDFMQKILVAMTRKETVIQEQARIILILQQQNSSLMDRLMARNLVEFKQATIHEMPTDVEYSKGPTFDFDESNAGEIINPEDEE